MENNTIDNKTNKNISKYILPIAIIIAGILVAGALYFRPNIGSQNSNNILQEALNPKIEIADINDTDHIIGEKDSKIVLIVYSDTECPFCKIYHQTLNKIADVYNTDKKIAVIYRHFPISYGENPLHKKAAKEAEATECAAELGGNEMFWKYINELYKITPSNDGLDLNKLPEIAITVGLDKTKFNQCLDSGKYADKIKESFDKAQKAGAKGTPYTVIKYKNEYIPLIDNQGKALGALPYEMLKQIIDQLLK